MNSQRILILSKYASSKEDGFESRLFALARRFVKFGNKVSIVSSDSNHFGNYPKYNKVYNYFNIEGVELVRIKTFKYYKTASFRRILSWLDFELKVLFFPFRKMGRPSVIIVSSLSLLTILNGILLKRKFKSKLVFEIRDIWPLTMVEEAKYSNRNPFVKILAYIEKLGYQKSDLVVGTMPNLKEHVYAVTGNQNIKCECVPFGFDFQFYSTNSINTDDFYTKYKIPKNKFIIGYAGSIGITNGLSTILECSKSLINDDRFFFIFLGDGDLRERLVEEYGNQKNVLFIPKVKREEVASFLSLCNLLYYSSLKSKIWEYGWSPNKLIDYMVAGKPVLASYSGYRSMIDEAQSGFFVPSEDPDSLKKVLQKIIMMSSGELEKMGKSGRDWLIKNRDWNVIANSYLEILRGINNE